MHISGNPDLVKNCTREGDVKVLRLPPGRYDHVTVYGGARLVLYPGEHWIHQLSVESDAQFAQENPDQATRVFLTGNLTWRGIIPLGGVRPETIYMASLSDQWNIITTPFFGTFMAPGGYLILGSGRDEEYQGRFYAKYIEVHQTTRITKVVFND